MNLMLIMSLRWTRSCPRTGGVLQAGRHHTLYEPLFPYQCVLMFIICLFCSDRKTISHRSSTLPASFLRSSLHSLPNLRLLSMT
jgi:hypothetical protein